jgi:2-polyprenyl-6-methoxyphenol hydroxylase-like FAD-dependent oxidoreductase
LIGDAAHVISPVGGNGINYALADAAETANQLVEPLRDTPVKPEQIDEATRRVEAVRRPPVDREQASQVRIEADSARRLRDRDPRPPGFLQVIALVPGLPRLIGRQSRKIGIPAPVPAILQGRALPAPRPPGVTQL